MMDDVQRLAGVIALDDAADVDLRAALRDDLDVDAAVGEDGEHAPSDADVVAQLHADEAEDGHLRDQRGPKRCTHVGLVRHLADGAQVREHALEYALAEVGRGGHRDLHLGRRDQVDDDAVLVERREDASEEAVCEVSRADQERGRTRDGLAVRAHVDCTSAEPDRRNALSMIFSLTVTAVGKRIGAYGLLAWRRSSTLPAGVCGTDGAAMTTVPGPAGRSTFLMRILMPTRVTCSIVCGWMTSAAQISRDHGSANAQP